MSRVNDWILEMNGQAKKVILGILMCILALALLAGAGLYFMVRDEKLARLLADEVIRDSLSSPAARANWSIPEGVVLGAEDPYDTDLFEKTWTYWYRLEPQGAMVVRIECPHGLPFLPILNRRKDLVVLGVEYIP